MHGPRLLWPGNGVILAAMYVVPAPRLRGKVVSIVPRPAPLVTTLTVAEPLAVGLTSDPSSLQAPDFMIETSYVPSGFVAITPSTWTFPEAGAARYRYGVSCL